MATFGKIADRSAYNMFSICQNLSLIMVDSHPRFLGWDFSSVDLWLSIPVNSHGHVGTLVLIAPAPDDDKHFFSYQKSIISAGRITGPGTK